jgi:enterochelin esterase-like enzyme
MLLVRLLLLLGFLLGEMVVQPTGFSNVSTSSFYSPSRGRTINFAIYTPPGYDEGNDHYPVLYFLHGIVGNFWLYWAGISENVPEANGDAGAWINNLIETGKIPPMIIVTPDDEDGHWGATNDTMVTQELVSYIDTHWRTIPHRWGRAIEGFSMGGMGASHYGALHPGTYCSTNIMAIPGVEDNLQDWQANRKAILANDLAVQLAVGDDDNDAYDSTNALHDGLVMLDIPHTTEIATGVGHVFGELYNVVGVKSLQFHAKCFMEHQESIERIFLPVLQRQFIPK